MDMTEQLDSNNPSQWPTGSCLSRPCPAVRPHLLPPPPVARVRRLGGVVMAGVGCRPCRTRALRRLGISLKVRRDPLRLGSTGVPGPGSLWLLEGDLEGQVAAQRAGRRLLQKSRQELKATQNRAESGGEAAGKARLGLQSHVGSNGSRSSSGAQPSPVDPSVWGEP